MHAAHVCNISGCGKTFSRSDSLRAHVSKMHTGREGERYGIYANLVDNCANGSFTAYMCAVLQCRQMFLSSGALSVHAAVHKWAGDEF